MYFLIIPLCHSVTRIIWTGIFKGTQIPLKWELDTLLLKAPLKISALSFKMSLLCLTHKSRLSSLLNQEELTPICTACLHSEDNQVAS